MGSFISIRGMCDPCGDIEDLNSTCGFARPREGSQVGTVDLFDKHLFVQTGHSKWNKKYPEGETEPVKELVKEIKARKKALSFSLKAIACDLPSEQETVDVCVFPEKKYILCEQQELLTILHHYLITY